MGTHGQRQFLTILYADPVGASFPARLLQQRLGFIRVVVVGRYVGRIGPHRWHDRSVGRFTDALVDRFDDLLFVDQVRQGLALLLIGQNWIGGVQIDVGVAGGGRAVDLELGRGLHAGDVLRRHR